MRWSQRRGEAVWQAALGQRPCCWQNVRNKLTGATGASEVTRFTSLKLTVAACRRCVMGVRAGHVGVTRSCRSQSGGCWEERGRRIKVCRDRSGLLPCKHGTILQHHSPGRPGICPWTAPSDAASGQLRDGCAPCSKGPRTLLATAFNGACECCRCGPPLHVPHRSGPCLMRPCPQPGLQIAHAQQQAEALALTRRLESTAAECRLFRWRTVWPMLVVKEEPEFPTPPGGVVAGG